MQINVCKPRMLNYVLLAVLSLTVVGALKEIGIILSAALLIAAHAIAFLLTRRFIGMLLTAVAVALGCLLGGIYLYFILDSPRPSIVLLITATLIVTFIRTMLASRAAA